MITILDTGIGNHFSVLKVFQKLRVPCQISRQTDDVLTADKLILPGVGNFASCIDALESCGLRPALEEAVTQRCIPLLGICVGMQMLSDYSEEGGRSGLGWIPGQTKRFPDSIGGLPLRIPHVGWNNVDGTGMLFSAIDAEARFYFTHSYYVDCADSSMIAGRTKYGVEFASAVRKGHIYGVQFHPEKSHADGMRLLMNFAENC